MKQSVKDLFPHLALVTLMAAGSGCAQQFQAEAVESPAKTSTKSKTEGSCGEGKCGEGKCGQGACGVYPGDDI